MLFPIINNHRYIHDLNGIWKFQIDPDNSGEKNNWFNNFQSDLHIAVPGTWNEQLEEYGLADYTGSVWYARKFVLPDYYFQNKKIWLRVGSADYYAKVWVNGNYIGENVGGFLPFEFDVTEHVLRDQENSLVLLVNNELTNDTIPQGITSVDYANEGRKREEMYPPARFDFFPYGGIHRTVVLYATPESHIGDVTVHSIIGKDSSATILIETLFQNIKDGTVKFTLIGNYDKYTTTELFNNFSNVTEMQLENCRLWSPDDPFLYDLKIEVIANEKVLDVYTLPVGIREITVDGTDLLLNGKKIFLKGFGKHEDFPVIGKGVSDPLMVKDFGILKWINANSFRTSHYPYAEEIMQYADKMGVLVIDEVPAVSLDFRYLTDLTKENHKQAIRRLYERDKNHPSVIMWAVGNEPNLVNSSIYFNGIGKSYWKEIIEFTRSLDKSRPITVPNCQAAGAEDPVFEFCDIISLNRYYGWYENPGQIDYAVKLFEEELDIIYEKYGKPVFVAEFGADTMAGFHSTSDQMFTEEYQSKLIKKYCELIESKDYTVGEHVWNFADFKTSQHFRRVVLNLKGVFTRVREPKLAAFTLKEIWKSETFNTIMENASESIREKQ